MEIKGKYEEDKYSQELKKRQEEANKRYEPGILFYEETTAGEFLNEKNTLDVPCYAFKPKKNWESVKETFLSDLRSKVDDDFFDSATKTIRVIREYFSVNYVDVRSVSESHLNSTKHYKPSGEYTIDGKLEDDTLKVGIRQGSTYSHTTYDISTSRKYVNSKKYYAHAVEKATCFTCKIVGDFADKFYCVDDVDESSLITAEEIMQDKLLTHAEPKSFLGSSADFTHLQILLFPIWRVEIDFNNHTYVNYVSDVAPSDILFYEPSSEMLKQKEEESVRKLKENELNNIANIFIWMALGIFGISLLVHFFTGNISTQGLGYCGFLVAHLGNFFGGFLTFICGGFSLVGAMVGLISLCIKKSKVKLIVAILANLLIIADLVLYITSVKQLVVVF